MKNLSELTDSELKEYYVLYKTMISESKRAEGVKINSFDLKYAYHIVRLLSEAEDILLNGDLDLQENGRKEHMKAIRKGQISENEIRQWASEKEKQLEKLFLESNLPLNPRQKEIKQLLVNCLEHHYGSLQACVDQTGWAEKALKDIDTMLGDLRVKLYQ